MEGIFFKIVFVPVTKDSESGKRALRTTWPCDVSEVLGQVKSAVTLA